MSWGFDEFAGETSYDSNFTTAGITYIAASGDSPGSSIRPPRPMSWPSAGPR